MRALFALLPFAPSRLFRAFTHTHTRTRIVASLGRFRLRFAQAKTKFEI